MMMKADHTSSTIYEGPSTRERIEVLAEHIPLFEHTAENPQTGIHERFDIPWQMTIAYVEGKVHRCSHAANEFIWNTPEDMTEKDLSASFSKIMEDLGDVLLLHANMVRAWQAMAMAPYPSKKSMHDFRLVCGTHDGIPRAANGESLLLYGEIDASVPSHVATICDEDFDPIEQIIVMWLMDPFLELIVNPFRGKLFKHRFFRHRYAGKDPNVKSVPASIITAFSRAFMVVIAILCLTAAIFVLQAVKGPKMRIMTMGMFAQVFTLPMQSLSSRSLPLYTLVIGWFQVMVMFVGTTDDKETC